MQDNESGPQNNHQLRRTVSLGPTMTSDSEDTSAAVYVNPLYEQNNQKPTDERNSSIRRQQSEPARNRFAAIKTNIVSRTESIRSMVKKGTAEFFGVNEENDDSNNERWHRRRMRLLSSYGKLKEQPVTKLIKSKAPINQITGGDETDGIYPTNVMTAFSENASQYIQELSPQLNEENSRRPAYQITFKALALASSAIKRKVSTRNDRPITRKTISDQMTEQTGDGSVSADGAPDSVFYESNELLNQCDDDFFKSITPIEEVDYNLRNRGQIPDSQNKWQLQRQMSVKAKGIPEQILNVLMENSNRRQFGLGFVGKLFDRKLKKDLTSEERKVLDHIDDYRPYFTYWITTVQILILIISLSAYGFGHWGFNTAHITGLVLVTSLSLQQVDYSEPENFWGGPRAADLIHLGAKFTPCMRKDLKAFEVINEERYEEQSTGCCIRNDGSGCVQSSKQSCSPLLSTWHKWNNNTNRGPRISKTLRTSGPVCGQDPQYCEQPASTEPYEWPDDITKWPVCRKKGIERSHSGDHMKCELIGRPCCLGVYGQCHITTREYCDFAKGFFHEEATLCSQVSCMENICGMIPFYSKDSPDQFYRVWTPIFLHAGLGHLVITVVFQYFIMRDIEKLAGVKRIAIIYLVSGVGGYLASAIFVPFRAEVGPAGSQFGILACLFVEVINSWDLIERPIIHILKLCFPALVLFCLGLLPWIDNYAHVTGFFIGFLLSLALLPYVTLRSYNRTRKILQILICLVSVTVIIITLFIILYKVPIYDYQFLKYFNCIPLSSNWCANQDIQINRVDIL